MDSVINKDKISKVDKSNIYQSVTDLSKQCLDAYEKSIKIEIPQSYKQFNNVVMSGMGGSGLGARIIESVYINQLKYPFYRVNGYNLPNWTDNSSLIFLCSYSGNTEETIACTQQAIKKKSKWIAVGAGGKLIEIAKKEKRPFYFIDPVYNPCKQPRMAIGYSLVSQLVFANKSNLFSFNQKDLKEIVSCMEYVVEKNNSDIDEGNNQALTLAKNIYQKQVVLVSSAHMTGAVHTVKNQMNENSKNFCVRFDVPELNHHLMEGLTFPKNNKNQLYFIFINSNLFPDIIQKRIKLTKEVVDKQGFESFLWNPRSTAKLPQVFELIQFGAFVNFYLAMLYSIDPAPIPWVDYFKKRLG